MSMTIEPAIYSGSANFFSLWRREIAKAAGIVENKDSLYSPLDKIDWQYFAKRTDFLGYWSEHPGDPIWFLIAHNDTQGILSVEHTKELSKRLKTIVPDLPGKEQYPNWQAVTKKIIKALNDAAKEQTELTFK